MIPLSRSKQTLALLLAFTSLSICQTATVQSELLGQQGFGSFASSPAPDLVQVRAEFTVATETEPARLFITAEVADAWHIYSITQPPGGPLKTQIQIDELKQFQLSGPFQAIQPPVVHNYDDIWPNLPVEEHEGTVVWYAPIELADGVDPSQLTITGKALGQVCKEMCLPFTLEFMAQLGKGVETSAVAATTAVAAPFGNGLSLTRMLIYGFLGGLILNVMPCVLPVIGLKVMSFVEQAGQSRGKAFALNVWYSLGLISVFLVLAALAHLAGMSWGEQFGSDAFNISLAVIVFALALSLIGVWEIPIPGFVGGSRASAVSQKEGPSGAFLKGVITTVLATPCTGPYMGTALGWAVKQPPGTIYAVFASMGIGMASPYLLIGAFPQLIRFIPKPGAWMNTFKQIMGFVLVGTVVFLFTFMYPPLIVPTLTFLAAVGAACWWIGRIPVTDSTDQKAAAWAGAIALAAGVGWYAFSTSWQYGLTPIMEHRFQRIIASEVARGGGTVQMTHGENELPWQPFTPKILATLQRQQKTVLVNFTADWCQTCKTLEALVLDTDKVRSLIQRNGVVTLYADFTRHPPELKRILADLQSNGVPVLAIYPASSPQQPIVFRGMYTQDNLIQALEKAGPSQPDSPSKPDSPSQPDSLTSAAIATPQ